jgi:hypothetical protein
MKPVRNVWPGLAALLCVALCCAASSAVAATTDDAIDVSGIGHAQPNVLNCTWTYVEQPLDHFARGANNEETFKLRACVNDKFLHRPDGPVFFCESCPCLSFTVF